MCGISGIINFNKAAVDEDLLRRMNNLIVHRGPDDEGYFIEDYVGLANRRLAIIDLSPDGHQPMCYDDGKLVVVYNGEIYNYLEIKEELIGSGYLFATHSDTEVILAAYKAWGHQCVNHFNGMWAFAVYDRIAGQIFCSRDRFGIKPFYYFVNNERFIFGSEIKQLLDFLPAGLVNTDILMDYLVTGFSEHTGDTFFKGVQSLQGGHNIIVDLKENIFTLNRYYEINDDPSVLESGESESVESFLESFRYAVQLRLRSDVKVGSCLSGGIDSSGVAAMASDQYHNPFNQKFQAIHASTGEIKTDESNYAKLVADELPIDLVTIIPDTEEFVAAIDDVFYAQEEPFGNPSVFMQYFVMKKASSLGCKVMLDGQGGDETLLGYARYYPAYLLSLPLHEAVSAFIQSISNSTLSFKKLAGYFFYFSFIPTRIGYLKNKFPFIRKELMPDFRWVKKNIRCYISIRNLQIMELFHTQLPHLLRYEDKNSMANSVEARLPFLDYKLVEKALSINNRYKIKNGRTKYILRKAMEPYLPGVIVWRKDKLGFEAPRESWLSAIKPQMLELVGSSGIIQSICKKGKLKPENLDNTMLWKLYSIAEWEKVFDVRFN